MMLLSCQRAPLHSSSRLPPKTLSQLEPVVRRYPSVRLQKRFPHNPPPPQRTDSASVLRVRHCHQLLSDLTTPQSLAVRTQDRTSRYSHMCTNHTRQTEERRRMSFWTHIHGRRQPELSLTSRPPLSLSLSETTEVRSKYSVADKFPYSCLMYGLANTVQSP